MVIDAKRWNRNIRYHDSMINLGPAAGS